MELMYLIVRNLLKLKGQEINFDTISEATGIPKEDVIKYYNTDFQNYKKYQEMQINPEMNNQAEEKTDYPKAM